MHQREVVHDAIIAALKAGSTDAGARVFMDRKIPDRKIELPLIAVYALDEKVTPESAQIAPRELTRSLSLVVEAWVAAKIADEDQDQSVTRDAYRLDEQIETAMHADPFFGGACGDCILDETEFEPVDSGDRAMMLILKTYIVTYRTLAPEPATDLDEFETAGVEFDLGGAQQPADRAHDNIVLQEPDAS